MTRRTMRAAGFAALLTASFSPGPAAAQGADSGTRGAARDLGYEGLKDFKAGHFSEALDKLSRAYAVVKVPSVGLWTARALEKNGRWVDAYERFIEVTRLPVEGGDTGLQEEAKAAAEREAQALKKKLPKLVVTVAGVDGGQVSIRVDDVPLPAALFGVARPTDPGAHVVRAEYDGKESEKKVELAAGATETVRFEFSSRAEPESQQSTGLTPGGAPTEDRGANWLSENQTLLGWIAVGVGGAGVALGTVTGLMALSEQSALDTSSSCDPDRRLCESAEYDRVDRYNALLATSSIGFIVGGVAAAGGAVLLLTAEGEPETARGMVPYVGPTGAGVWGRF